MMVEAEAVVRYNWLDVALHDKAKIEEAPYDHVYIWIVTETGSHLIPMYCETKEKLKIEGTQYTLISHGIYNFVTRNNTTPLCNLPDHSYYLVVKRHTPDGGDIIPVDLDSFLDLVSVGRWAWDDEAGVVHADYAA
jgi:hypothetical protein